MNAAWVVNRSLFDSMIQHRPFMRSFRSTSVAFVLVAAAIGVGACSAAATDATTFGGTGGSSDATPGPLDDAGTSQFGGPEDASIASASKYNPLCHVGTPCVPDDTAPAVSNMCNLPDAGIVVGSGPGDGGDYDAGPSPIACHVTLDTTSTTGDDTQAICTASGAGGNGAACIASTDCAAGFECVGSPGVCRQYCCTLPASCAAGFFCDVQEETSAGSVKVPVCEPVQPCQLLGGDATCGNGETCGIVNDDDGTTSCVDIGPADVGQACDDTHCKKDLVCLGDVGSKKCLALCTKNNPNCDTGQTCSGAAPLFTGQNANYGVCQ
jgi:hypothetical protein